MALAEERMPTAESTAAPRPLKGLAPSAAAPEAPSEEVEEEEAALLLPLNPDRTPLTKSVKAAAPAGVSREVALWNWDSRVARGRVEEEEAALPSPPEVTCVEWGSGRGGSVCWG